MILAIIWVFVALGMAFYARRYEMGFWKYLAISLFLTPIIGVIAFAVDSAQIKARKQEAIQRETLKTLKKIESEKAQSAPQ